VTDGGGETETARCRGFSHHLRGMTEGACRRGRLDATLRWRVHACDRSFADELGQARYTRRMRTRAGRCCHNFVELHGAVALTFCVVDRRSPRSRLGPARAVRSTL
jgi:hypothetical protein